ncbi:MAG: heavy metal translocating P-type ATPase [Pseudomonadales bacterium]
MTPETSSNIDSCDTLSEVADKPHKHSCCSTQAVNLQGISAPVMVEGKQRTQIRIMQMDCPTEEALIRKKLGALSTVESLEFNLMQRVLTVVHTPESLDDVVKGIRSLGYVPEVPDENGKLDESVMREKPWWPLVIAAALAALSEAMGWLGMPSWLAPVTALTAIALCGVETYSKGWVALKNANLNINALMSIAVTGALILGEWPEAAMVMVLFTLAEVIEAKSLDRARNAIKGLMDLSPEVASVKQSDGHWLEVATNEVAIGDIVRVKPGERIGLDGVVVNGASAVNQAPITGESLAVDKTIDDEVFAGTINEAGSFEYRVTAAAGGTTLARIIHAVEQAQGAKAPIQRFVDKFSQIYTPIVFVAAALVALLPPLLLDGMWQAWIYKALVLLVIACPCALVISTPVTIVSALAAAARSGILIKGGVYLEQGRHLRWLALDKTGTITQGKPELVDFELLSGSADAAKKLAYSLSSRSDHPVSAAIRRGCNESDLLSLEGFSALLGKGVKAKDGESELYLGNRALVAELGLLSVQVEERFSVLERQGKTVVALIGGRELLALFAVADKVKESSRDALHALHGLGVKTAMLSGDNQHTVDTIAAQVGIDLARGNQLPQGKLAWVEQSQREGCVGMVGDGINDAPALAQADIGFAMGAMGTDTAIETADVALMDDDLGKIATFIELSKSAHRTLVQNISFAIGVKAIFLALTLVGLGTMWMAVFADVGASLLVVANGLRLLKAV